MSDTGKTSAAAVPPLLTQREMMILFLMSAGHTASEIAKLLGLRPRTVENRKRSIYEKLGVGNQSHAVAKAIWLGLLQPGSPPVLPRRGPVPQQQAAGERGRALLAVLLGPASKSRDEMTRLLISERVPLVVAIERDELIRDHWVWWQRGPIVVVLVDPEPQDWTATIALGAPTVLIRSSEVPERAVADALARQASGVVAKADAAAGLAATLAAVAQGLMVMSWEYAGVLPKWAPSASPTVPKLTAREFDILGSIARGHTIRQTARALGIAAKTVENTQARLFRKLGVRNRTEALTIADALGLIAGP
jgi:two-component system nitrate/nitrite response regulator NarL